MDFAGCTLLIMKLGATNARVVMPSVAKFRSTMAKTFISTGTVST